MISYYYIKIGWLRYGKKIDNSYLKLDKKQKQLLLNRLGINDILDLDKAILSLLKKSLKKVTDKRQQWKITYKIWDIVCYVVASFCIYMIGMKLLISSVLKKIFLNVF